MAVIALRPGLEKATLAEYSERETRRFKELVSEKTIGTYYSKKDYPKFWCIVSATSFSDAEKALHSLPFYQQGFLTIEMEEIESAENGK